MRRCIEVPRPAGLARRSHGDCLCGALRLEERQTPRVRVSCQVSLYFVLFCMICRGRFFSLVGSTLFVCHRIHLVFLFQKVVFWCSQTRSGGARVRRKTNMPVRCTVVKCVFLFPQESLIEEHVRQRRCQQALRMSYCCFHSRTSSKRAFNVLHPVSRH